MAGHPPIPADISPKPSEKTSFRTVLYSAYCGTARTALFYPEFKYYNWLCIAPIKGRVKFLRFNKKPP